MPLSTPSVPLPALSERDTSGFDAWTPLSIALVNRLRQPSVWLPPIALTALYFISSSIHSGGQAVRSVSSSGIVAVSLLLAWLISASGARDPAGSSVELGLNVTSSGEVRLLLFSSMTALGRATADAVVGVGGIAFCALAPEASLGSSPNGLVLVVAAAPIFVAASLQMDLALRFAQRSVALLLTALVAMVTLVHAVSASTLGLGRLGGLLFPVSGVAHAAEVPLGLELAARATLPGALYDLALFAALLALRPLGAPARHEDRDRQ